MKNIIILLKEYQNNTDDLVRLEVFSDFSGRLTNCETEEIVFDFENKEELEEKLKPSIIMKTGIQAFSEEREKQISKHGFTGKHHAEHPEWYDDGQLIAAANYLLQSFYGRPNPSDWFPKNWDKEWFHRLCAKSYLERLIIAGALLAAEYDRLEALGELNNKS